MACGSHFRNIQSRNARRLYYFSLAPKLLFFRDDFENPATLFAAEMARKENALDLAKFIDKGVRVKLSGGREVEGVLKGYDQLLNLVMDETVEYLRETDDPLRVTDEKRSLGLVVCRGTAVQAVMPTAGTEEIANPFLVNEDE